MAPSSNPENTNRPADSARHLASRFWRAAKGFWCGPTARGAWLLVGLLVVFVLLQLALQYRLNLWSRDFFDAFGRRDGPALREQALIFLPLAASSLMVAMLLVWARMTTQREWRGWLTHQLIARWVVDERARRLRFTPGEDRNPEYRIAEDARVATDAPITMAVGLLTAVLNAVTFIGILWHVGGDLTVSVLGHVLTVPKYLVITVAIYAGVVSVAMTFIGRRLVHGIADKNAAEAQFRSIASDLRESGDIASPAPGGTTEQGALSRALDEVIACWRTLCFQLMRITLVSQGNLLVAPVVAWILCAPKYLVGTMSLGEVAQAAAAFVTVQAALNWLVDNFPGLADCLSSVKRVASLLMALDEGVSRGEPDAAAEASVEEVGCELPS